MKTSGPDPHITPAAPDYSPKQKLKVFRAIADYIAEHPNELKDEGVFRISSTASRSFAIIENIINGKPFTRPEYEIHDYIGALKKVMANGNLLDSEDPAVITYQKIVAGINKDDEAEVTLGKQALHAFLNDLVNSGEAQKIAAAEVLHTLFHLMKSATAYKITNKMPESNLASIMMMQMTNVVMPEAHPNGANHTAIYLSALESNDFKPKFEDRYAGRILRLKSEQMHSMQEQIGTSEQWKTQLERLRKQHADRAHELTEIIRANKQQVIGLDAWYKAKKITKADYDLQRQAFTKNISKLESQLDEHTELAFKFVADLKKEHEQAKRMIEKITDLRSSMDVHRQRAERSPESSLPSSESSSPMSTSPASSPEASPRIRETNIRPDLQTVASDLKRIQRGRMSRVQLAASYAEDVGPELKKGVKELKDKGFSIEEIGTFLFAYKHEVDPAELGELLGKKDNVDLLNAYAQQMDFSRMNFGQALRVFMEQGGFKMPGEAQVIDRFMTAFGRQYSMQNPGGSFTEHPDRPYQIGFATMMLHSDLHNPGVKTKMTREQFIKRQVIDNFYKDAPKADQDNASKAAGELYEFIEKNKFKAFDTSKKETGNENRKPGIFSAKTKPTGKEHGKEDLRQTTHKQPRSGKS